MAKQQTIRRTVNSLLIAICLCLFVSIIHIEASCPNHCNGNGLCDKYSRCECSASYTGADCSLRICPFGFAWSDNAVSTDVAHQSAECSNRGNCDRETGVCKCMEGFTGSACERLTCNLGCNNRGRCMSMRDFSAKTRDEYSNSYEYLEIWDAEKIQGCHCDYPGKGYDCSERYCPAGDDPLTLNQVNEIQLVQCIADTGSFVLFYNGLPSASIPHNANAATVKKALLHIPKLTDIKVTFSMPYGTACQKKSNVIQIEFTQQFGAQHPLVPLGDEKLKASGGYIDVSADGSTSFKDVAGKVYKSVKGTKENEACSNRGSCDENEGVCTCYDTNGDEYGSSDGYGKAGSRGDCGYVVSAHEKAVATCPGEVPCSGHGVCDTSSSRCYCSAGWDGGDCSEKSCPLGRSWFSYPETDNVAHFDYVECGNMGLCDKTIGKCQCRPGFYGEACEYMACGGPYDQPCSGHGRCMTMAELALWADANGDATDYTYGSDPNNPYTWDHDRIHGCYCDTGFTGYDCSLKECPGGDDPGTYDDHSEVQLLQCIADDGNFTLSFRQQETSILSYNITAPELRQALNRLSTIRNVSVYFIFDGPLPDETLNYVKPSHTRADGMPDWGNFIGTNGTFAEQVQNHTIRYESNSTLCRTDGLQIAVIHFTHTHGDLPPIQVNNTFLFDFTNGDGGFHSGTIRVHHDGASMHGLESIKGTTENDVCNNRGLCNYQTGQCECFETWSSSDGMRQGGPGSTGDCGYRNDKKFSYFDSISLRQSN